MKALKLVVPGAFEDAIIYMGYLVALTSRRSLVFYHLQRLVLSLAEDVPEALLQYYFLRNDWLFSEAYGVLSRDSQIGAALASQLSRAPMPAHIDEAKAADAIDLELDVGFEGTVLDLHVYCRRLYASATSGFYHIDISWNELGDLDERSWVKRHDARSISSTAGMGAINVSCGDDGLFSAYDEFDWSGRGLTEGFVHTAERSVRSAWFSHDLVNYASRTSSSLLESREMQTDGKGPGQEASVITKLSEALDFGLHLRKAVGRLPRGDSIQFMANTRRYAFALTARGVLFVVGRDNGGESPEMKLVKKYEGTRGQVLDVCPSRTGLIVETEDRVDIFHEGRIWPLHDGAVLTVRAFPRSKRYKNLIVITDKEGIVLLSPAATASES